MTEPNEIPLFCKWLEIDCSPGCPLENEKPTCQELTSDEWKETYYRDY